MTTKTRPNHYGAWMPYYDGRDAMTEAGKAALVDAAAAEVDGWPTADTAAEWLDAMKYYIATFGGGVAEWDARPDGPDAIQMAKKALVAAAEMAMKTVVRTQMSGYMPLNTIGYRWYHDLLELAYLSPSLQGGSSWAARVTAAIEDVRRQWGNSDWPWQAKRVLEFALGRLAKQSSRRYS